jgi:predicted dehydrogenase
MIHAALAGLGWWGKTMVEAVQGKSDRLRFTCGVTRNPGALHDFAATHGLRLVGDLETALADPAIDAVVLATPHSLHCRQIIAAAAAKKPVYCEKPLTLTRADAVQAIEACERAGILLGIGTDKRYLPAMQELARRVAAGELGPIRHVEGHCSNENSGRFSTWRNDPQESPAGGMTGTGVHILDAMVRMLGGVRRVHAQLLTQAPAPDPQDTISVMLEFASGVSGLLAAVRTTPYFWRVHVFGRDASAEALGRTELVIRRRDREPERLTLAPVNSVRAGLEAFADALEGRAAYPIATREMLDVVAAFEAIGIAAASPDRVHRVCGS